MRNIFPLLYYKINFFQSLINSLNKISPRIVNCDLYKITSILPHSWQFMSSSVFFIAKHNFILFAYAFVKYHLITFHRGTLLGRTAAPCQGALLSHTAGTLSWHFTPSYRRYIIVAPNSVLPRHIIVRRFRSYSRNFNVTPYSVVPQAHYRDTPLLHTASTLS